MLIAIWLLLFIALPTGIHAQTRWHDISETDASRIRVIDGDTIDLAGRRVRLFGIDAPESKQRCVDGTGIVYLCGQAAAKALRGIVLGRSLSCEPRDIDRYGRVVAICWIGETNINEQMVRDGWALAYRRFSRDYVAAEDEAREAKRGL
jgi:endonuclease YncB( thermonuclease family)